MSARMAPLATRMPILTTSPVMEIAGGVTINQSVRLMKKLNYLLAAVAVMAMAGCAKEKDVTPVSNVVTLRATVENTNTRVSIDNAYAYAFQSGDLISVALTNGNLVDFEAAAGGTTVNFDGTLESGQVVGNYAFYPASENHEVYQVNDEEGVSFYMNDHLTWKADESFMPMLGKISEGTITFKAVGGVMKLIVYNIPSSATTLKFTSNDKRISGYYSVENLSSDSPVIETFANNGGSDDVLYIDFSGNYSPNMVFYIPLPTRTNDTTIDGFTITFQNGEGDIPGATKSTSANLNVTRNKIIIAPALNMGVASGEVVWKETFTGYAANTTFNNSAINTTGNYDAIGEGIKYTSVNGTQKGTSVFATSDDYNAGASIPELYVGKSNGYFEATNIPSNGAAALELTYYTNNDNITASTSTAGVTLGSVSADGNKRTVSITIANPSADKKFSLKFAVGSGNARLDDIQVETKGAPAPDILVGSNAVTISAGNLNASVTGVSLSNPMDGLGIGVSYSADWIASATIDVANNRLDISARSYQHVESPRSATITLKATGAADKTITVTQNPSVVPNPTLNTPVGGNRTFTVTWTGDGKAGSYDAYYSTTSNLDETGNPATDGIALNVTHTGNAYSASPEEATLSNGTTYYIYVRVGSVAAASATKYVASPTWSKAEVTPSAGATVTFTYSSSSATNYGNAQNQSYDGISIVTTNGTSNNPVYNGAQFRVYAGSTMTVSVDDTTKKITSIIIEVSTNNYTNLSASGLSWNGVIGTWNGTPANSVAFTATGQARIKSIMVTYE